jgi:hypothetical protein
MIKFIIGFLLICCDFQLYSFEFINDKISSERYLEGRISSFDKRYATMKYALDLMSERDAKVIVETGTARYGAWSQGFGADGGSTIIFGDWAKSNGGLFYSVDINPQAVETAQKALGINKNSFCICQDSISFLKEFDQPIDFLYLDSFDFDLNNPIPSQEHHLKEITAIYSKLTPQSVVMIDDCGLPHGGKGKFAIPYLLERGWVILAEGYQVILSRQ